ncbi:hypothetical protein YH62_25345 [Rhizobium sp. LC145]|nr:hypothetical protein YH62_25345 [Rhizobium sp. LC145]
MEADPGMDGVPVAVQVNSTLLMENDIASDIHCSWIISCRQHVYEDCIVINSDTLQFGFPPQHVTIAVPLGMSPPGIDSDRNRPCPDPDLVDSARNGFDCCAGHSILQFRSAGQMASDDLRGGDEVILEPNPSDRIGFCFGEFEKRRMYSPGQTERRLATECHKGIRITGQRLENGARIIKALGSDQRFGLSQLFFKIFSGFHKEPLKNSFYAWTLALITRYDASYTISKPLPSCFRDGMFRMPSFSQIQTAGCFRW